MRADFVRGKDFDQNISALYFTTAITFYKPSHPTEQRKIPSLPVKGEEFDIDGANGFGVERDVIAYIAGVVQTDVVITAHNHTVIQMVSVGEVKA